MGTDVFTGAREGRHQVARALARRCAAPDRHAGEMDGFPVLLERAQRSGRLIARAQDEIGSWSASGGGWRSKVLLMAEMYWY